MSKHIFYSIVLLSSLYAETNETKLYMDRYLPKERLEPYSEKIGKITDVKKPDINVSKFKKEYNITVKHDIPEEIRNIAEEINEHKNSQAFRQKLNDAKDYILRDKDLGKYENLKTENMVVSGEKDKASDYYIFISSSMPEEVLKNYFEQLDGNKSITFVLRGFIGGIKKAKPTFEWIANILQKNKDERYNINLTMDPSLAQKCDIKKVPAFTMSTCENIVYGAVDQFWAMNRLQL